MLAQMINDTDFARSIESIEPMNASNFSWNSRTVTLSSAMSYQAAFLPSIKEASTMLILREHLVFENYARETHQLVQLAQGVWTASNPPNHHRIHRPTPILPCPAHRSFDVLGTTPPQHPSFDPSLYCQTWNPSHRCLPPMLLPSELALGASHAGSLPNSRS
jgi:hypothetical protein